jgi:hypothetical protein
MQPGLFLVGLFALSLYSTPVSASPDACLATATSMARACRFEAIDDYHKASAFCHNESDTRGCIDEAASDRNDTFVECEAELVERSNVCRTLGPAKYSPPFGPDHANQFVDPRAIGKTVQPNTYFPMIEGARWVFQKPVIDDEGDEEIETVTVVVTNRTKLIDGIHCRVVRDTVMVDDEVLEDTHDWIAQDRAGNLWYCGEEVKDYEYTEGDRPELPELVSRDGSFKAGRDGAKAGILMFANPQVGVTYREEADWGNAEDLSEVLSTTASARARGASCQGNCLKLRAFSPREPGISAQKFYAPGIGPILEISHSGERLELVRYHIPR